MDFKRQLFYACRSLRKTPGFCLMVISIIAVGVGAHTAMFTLVRTVLLRPLPYRAPDQLVWAWSQRPDNRGPFNVPDFIDYRDRNRTLDSIAAYAEVNANLTGNGEPVRLQGLRVTANLFRLVGATAALGRTLEPEDDRADAPAAIVLTHMLWRTRFGGDPGIVGQELVLDGSAYTVAGILTPDFIFPKATAEYAVPLRADSDPARAQRISINRLRVIGRLKPGVSLRQAQDDLSFIARQLRSEYPVANSLKLGVQLVPLEAEILGVARESLAIVVAAVSVLLLIVSINVSSLLLARAAGSRKEAAIRVALGANRVQLITQSLAENMLLTVSGGAIGIVLAKWGIDLLIRSGVLRFPRVEFAAIDGTAVWYAGALSVAIGVLVGLLPARHVSSNISDALKSVSRGTTGGSHVRRLRAVMIVGEVALSFALLVAGVLLAQSLSRLNRVDPGFEGSHVLAVGVSLPRSRYSDHGSIQAFLDRAAVGLMSERGVESYSLASILPVSGSVSMAPFSRKDRPVTPDRRQFANYRFVAPDYFRTMGIQLKSGREFSPADRDGSAPVVIVSDQFAVRYLGDTDAIGSHLLVSDNDKGPREVEVVGIVSNVKQFALDDDPSADLYVPLLQVPNEPNGFVTKGFTLVFRCLGNPNQMRDAIKQHLLKAEPEGAFNSRTMTDLLTESLAVREFQAVLITGFAIFAALLAGFGMYSVMSYLTVQRTQEIGIRMALGATAPGILRLVISQAIGMAVAGMVAGAAILSVGYRFISSMLYMPGASDSVVIVGCATAILLIAAIATWLPATRATRIVVISALRES
jgi:putative ABC transport system permease protein